MAKTPIENIINQQAEKIYKISKRQKYSKSYVLKPSHSISSDESIVR